MASWWNPKLKNHVCRIHHGFHELSLAISVGWSVGLLQIKTIFILARHACVLAQSVSVAKPVIYKRLSHRSGRIKGFGKGSKLTERYLAFQGDLILKAAVFMKPQHVIMFL